MRRVGVVAAWRAPSDRDLRLADIAGPLAIAKPGRAILARARAAVWSSRRQRAVAALRLAQRVVRIDVANDDENRVPRTVEVPVKRDQLLSRQRAESGLAPNPPAPDAVSVVQHLVQSLDREGVRVVGLSLRLLNDDL